MQGASHYKQIFLFSVILLSFGWMSSCGKGDLDRTTDEMIKKLQSDDYDGFKALLSSDLRGDLTQEKFTFFSSLISRLGAFKERTMKGIKAETGGIRQGDYELRFEKGTVDLFLKTKEGSIVQFEFTGKAIERAKKELIAEKYKTFQINKFTFLDANGTPKNNVFHAGDKVGFRVDLQGLTPVKNVVQMKANLQLLTPQGELLLDKPDFVDMKQPLKPDDPNTAQISGNVTVPNAGVYKLKLKIVDVSGNRSLDVEQVFSVE